MQEVQALDRSAMGNIDRREINEAISAADDAIRRVQNIRNQLARM